LFLTRCDPFPGSGLGLVGRLCLLRDPGYCAGRLEALIKHLPFCKAGCPVEIAFGFSHAQRDRLGGNCSFSSVALMCLAMNSRGCMAASVLSETGLITHSSHKRQAIGVRDPLLGRYRLWDKGPVAGARRVHVGLIGQGPEPCASVGGGAALDGAAMGLAVGIACWSAVSPRSQINIRSSNHMRCTCGEAERFTASQPFLLSNPAVGWLPVTLSGVSRFS